MKFSLKPKTLALTALFAAGIAATSVQAHHSFAMYDMNTIRVFTGVVTRVDPQPNHLQIFFAPMNEERKNVERDANGEPLIWAVEMQGSAAMARQGVSVNTFPPGTVFSVAMQVVGETVQTRRPKPSRTRSGKFACNSA